MSKKPIAGGIRMLTSVGLVAFGLVGCQVAWNGEGDGRPVYLQRYIDAHYRGLGERFVQPMSRDEFAARLEEVRVLFLGDHHRDERLHRNMLALIEWICDAGHRPILGLEAIGSQDNPNLQTFLAGEIDLAELRKRIARRWPQSWLESDGVDKAFFRSLLQLAKDRNLDAFPLEPTPRYSLQDRDAVIAKNIKRVLRLYPDRLIIVTVGHAHLLGDGHLAARIGASSLSIAARFSPALEKAFATHPELKDPKSFLRTDGNVLFFPVRGEGKVSD